MFADHDTYIAAAPEVLRPLLMHLRAQLTQALPDEEEVIRCDMPGLGLRIQLSVQYTPPAAGEFRVRHLRGTLRLPRSSAARQFRRKRT